MLRRRTVIPFIGFLILFGRTTRQFDENDVHADFLYLFPLDKNVAFAPMKALSARHDDAEHSALGIGKHGVANLSQPFPVYNVDRFFFSEFLKTCFHILLYACNPEICDYNFCVWNEFITDRD